MSKTKCEAVIRQMRAGGAIQTILLEACPENSEGFKSIPLLASALNLSRQAVYAWIEKDCIPASRAKSLVKLSNGKVTMEQLVPFVVK